MSNLTLPTLDKLGVTLPDSLDASQIAKEWLQIFSDSLFAKNYTNVLNLLSEDAFFRDLLVFTWDLRTFHGPKIKSFFEEHVANVQIVPHSFNLTSATLEKPYPDLAWIQGLFTFETDISFNSGVFRLIPTTSANGIAWKAHTVFTNMEDLKGFPEKIGPNRNFLPNHGKWAQEREKEAAFVNEDPTVLIIGAGQSGLDVGARLKALGVNTLLVESSARVGDQWRNRYEALCLHDPVWFDHLPYLPFPPNWPVYTPARKLADWLESYAHTMELNIWTSTTVLHASQDPVSKNWSVLVRRPDNSERTLVVNHLVFATGFRGGRPQIPVYPGTDDFKGQILHSSAHKKASDHAGKKVLVIGACTSGHDIASDYCNHGIDVTLFQRGPTYIMTTKEGMPRIVGGLWWEGGLPTDVADRVNASYPNQFSKLMHIRITKDIAEADKEILDGLKRVGFKLSMGIDGSGFLQLAWERAGGYYLDVGASQMIIDGKIKLKNDSLIERFTETGIRFENGSELDADVVIFATGLGDAREVIQDICGEEVANKCKRIWGLDREGEINSCWKDIGVSNLWYMSGNLALCRFYSKHLALQIKAMEEGIFTTRYNSTE